MEELQEGSFDLARFVFGAYQSYGEKPASVTVEVYRDGTCVELVRGQVNPCKFGDQCEGHSCYCNCAESPYRKCHNSWYYGENDADSKCEFFQPNPYWQEGEGDFYEQREKTLLYLQSQNLLELEIEQVDSEPDEYYKGRRSELVKEKKLSEVYIPFQEQWQDKMLDGIKVCTTRTKAYGRWGDTFKAFGAIFVIIAVDKKTLEDVAENFFHQEGCVSPEEFINVWEGLHPIKKWVPKQVVWCHHFRILM